MQILTSANAGVEVAVTLEPALSVQEAALLAGSMLPDSELQWTALIPATPLSETQIRLHEFRDLRTGSNTCLHSL